MDNKVPNMTNDRLDAGSVDDILGWYRTDAAASEKAAPETVSEKAAPETANGQAAPEPAGETQPKPEPRSVPEPKPKKKSSQPGVLSDLIGLLLKIAWIGLFFAILLVFVVGLTVNSGERMTPAFHDRDVIVYYRLARDYDAGEVIVYLNESGEPLIGRVVAKGGDEVDITADGLMINGYYQTESYITGDTVLFEGGPSFPMTLREGEYFVLSDNRAEGSDSRTLGAISGEEIKGRVMLSIRQRDF